jgi:hypothetical protein
MQNLTQVPTMTYDIRKDKQLRNAMLKLYNEAAAEFWSIRYERNNGMLFNPHEWRDVRAVMSTTHQFLRQHGHYSSYRLKAIAKKAGVE